MESKHQLIKKDIQVKKFGYYGLLKNLQFFEPYLYVYLLSLDVNLFHIGLLIAVREIIIYVFEIPSGIFADYYGKKTELIICFVFYIISFVLFFVANNFILFMLAMILYGLGDAFRSGTHKAMIYSYLEKNKWFDEKAYVYGRTRSFSLIGSSASAFASIFLIIYFKDLSWIFLLTVVPFIFNFALILTYPNYLNEKKESELSFIKFLRLSYFQLKSIFKSVKLLTILTSSSLFDAIFKTVKDYIQPIIVLTITSLGFSFLNFDDEINKKIVLGLIYGVFYIFSSVASRQVYRLKQFANSKILMNLLFDTMAVILVLIFLFIRLEITIVLIVLYLLLYLLKNARRPLIVDVAGDVMEKQERATVLSIDSQLKALFVIVLAPVFGFISDYYSIGTAFLVFAIGIFVSNGFIKYKMKHL